MGSSETYILYTYGGKNVDLGNVYVAGSKDSDVGEPVGLLPRVFRG